MKRHNIYIPVQMLEQIKALSARTGLSSAELIRQAIVAFLEKRETNQKERG